LAGSVVRKNNVLAGLFVLGSIALAVVIAVVLGEIDLGEKKRYTVRFDTEVGVSGLEPGAEVLFGGMSVGRVTKITPVRSGGTVGVPDSTDGQAPVESIDVEIVIDASIVLYEDALGDLSPPLLGGVSTINFRSPGGAARNDLNPDPGGVLNEGEIAAGRYAPSILMQLGFTPEYADRIRDVIDNARAVSDRAIESVERVNEMTKSLEQHFGDGVEDGASILANLRGFSDNFVGDDGWSSDVESVLANTRDASDRFPGLMDDAQGTVVSAREMIDTNSMRVRRILDNTERATERFNRETFDRVHELIDRGAVALASFDEGVRTVTETVRTNRPQIDETMENVNATSLQARLMVEELRSQPWRILSKPDAKELEREPIYGAARAYAGAVSELRSASRALDDAVETNAALPSSPEDLRAQLQRLASVVDEAYQRYAAAERELLELLADR